MDHSQDPVIWDFLQPLFLGPFPDPSANSIESGNEQYDPTAGQLPEPLPELGGGLNIEIPPSPPPTFWNAFFPNPPVDEEDANQLFFG